MLTAEYHYNLFADFHQFSLQDEKAEGDLSDSWTPEAIDRLLALALGMIGVGTARDTTVPITVQVWDAPPSDDLTRWDQVNECSLAVPSGRIVIAGGTDYFPDAARITVAPGLYRVRLYYGGLDTLRENGLAGDDRYCIALWPAPEVDVVMLKYWKYEANEE